MRFPGRTAQILPGNFLCERPLQVIVYIVFAYGPYDEGNLVLMGTTDLEQAAECAARESAALMAYRGRELVYEIDCIRKNVINDIVDEMKLKIEGATA